MRLARADVRRSCIALAWIHALLCTFPTCCSASSSPPPAFPLPPPPSTTPHPLSVVTSTWRRVSRPSCSFPQCPIAPHLQSDTNQPPSLEDSTSRTHRRSRRLEPTRTRRKRQSPDQPLVPDTTVSPQTPGPTSSTAPELSSPSPPSPPKPEPSSAMILPQNEPNITLRVFPYTPETGANNSLTLTPNVTMREGLVEIKVGVLLPFSLPNNLTQQLAFSGTSAIRLAASEINAQQIIPGAYITLVLKDSFNGLDPDNSGAAQAIFSTVSLLQSDRGVSGVIGDVSSALSVQSALLTSRLSIPQCSFSAGSIQLSNKDDYSYFFRTIPTELMFGTVMLDFVANRGWSTVAVFYTSDSLGSGMMDNIADQARLRNITIGYHQAFWDKGANSELAPVLDGLVESGLRVILIAAVGVPQVKLMLEAVRRGLVSKDYVWLTTNQVAQPLLGEDSTMKPKDLNGLFMFDNLLKLHGYHPYEQFLDKWAALDTAEYPYAGQRDISSNEALAYSCMMVMAHGFATAVRGNWTALRHLAYGRLGSNFKPTNMNTGYVGPGGPMVFDDSGDVVYGNFLLSNYQNGSVVPIGTSYSGVFNLSSPPMYFDGTYNTPRDSAPLQVLNPKFGSSIGLVIISVAGISIAFSLMTMAIVIIYRNAPVIKASSPLFCCLELVGFILLYVSTIMGLDIPTPFACIARPLALNVGFILVVGNIVAKNFRVYRIFHNIYVTKRVIKDAQLLKIVGTVLLGNMVIMIAWFIKVPIRLQQVAMPDFTSYWTCENQQGDSMPFFIILYIYDGALLLVATHLAYMNRNVASNYNECRQIAFVVYNILLSGCLAMPTLFLPHDQFLTKFVLSTVVILFGTTFSVLFLFLPKLWELFTQIERTHQNNRRGNGCSGTSGDTSDVSSVDNFIYNGSGGTAWMNSTSNLAVFAQGSNACSGAGVAGGSSISGSNCQAGGGCGGGHSGGRKGSVGTLEESKGETLKEMHLGFMGVRFQYRFLPFLSSWCMRRVVLYPNGRFFTCFETGKPETGRTYSYVNVLIHSRDPGKYVLKVIGGGRYDFLFQVRDEERLLYWYGLFESGRQPGLPQGFTTSNTTGVGTILPHGSLSLANLSIMGATSHVPSDIACTSSDADPSEGMSIYRAVSDHHGSDGAHKASTAAQMLSVPGGYMNGEGGAAGDRHTKPSYRSVSSNNSTIGPLDTPEAESRYAEHPQSQSVRPSPRHYPSGSTDSTAASMTEVERARVLAETASPFLMPPCRHGHTTLAGVETCRLCRRPSSYTGSSRRGSDSSDVGSASGSDHRGLRSQPSVLDLSELSPTRDGRVETLELAERSRHDREHSWQSRSLDRTTSNPFDEY